MGLEHIRNIKEQALEPKQKKIYHIPKVSKKRAARIEQEKELRNGNDTLMEQWFKARRKNLVGVCQCGCARLSQKKDDMYFRHSICHIFPKSKFESVMYHPLNYVERAFFGGCHSIMDDTSMDRWVGMADFDDIKAKFYELAPMLTDEERATKFYSHLEKLVYAN
jgi:hypothetical protein